MAQQLRALATFPAPMLGHPGPPLTPASGGLMLSSGHPGHLHTCAYVHTHMKVKTRLKNKSKAVVSVGISHHTKRQKIIKCLNKILFRYILGLLTEAQRDMF